MVGDGKQSRRCRGRCWFCPRLFPLVTSPSCNHAPARSLRICARPPVYAAMLHHCSLQTRTARSLPRSLSNSLSTTRAAGSLHVSWFQYLADFVKLRLPRSLNLDFDLSMIRTDKKKQLKFTCEGPANGYLQTDHFIVFYQYPANNF